FSKQKRQMDISHQIVVSLLPIDRHRPLLVLSLLRLPQSFPHSASVMKIPEMRQFAKQKGPPSAGLLEYCRISQTIHALQPPDQSNPKSHRHVTVYILAASAVDLLTAHLAIFQSFSRYP